MWLIAVSAGLGLTYLLARRIVEPVKQLDRAAAEVARQNYAIAVEVNSEDEMGRLARTFNNMCASIRQAREDLIRQERISTIGRLSGSIVHDLRNPLAAIYGGAEMMVDADLPPGARETSGGQYLPRVAPHSGTVAGPAERLARQERRRPRCAACAKWRSAACDSLAAAAEAQGVSISLAIPPEIEVATRAQPHGARLRQPRSATRSKPCPKAASVRISASRRGRFRGGYVEDTGPESLPRSAPNLFQPFVTAGKRNGLGLGLALTRQTVIEHGGDMWVESEPGRGARFVFRLPGAQVSHPAPVHA